MNTLEGKVALVTGGGRGIGRAICIALSEAGAKVAVADRSEQDAAETAKVIDGLAIAMDVTDFENLAVGVERIEDTLGGVDILVNNAGIFNMASIDKITVEDYRRQYDDIVIYCSTKAAVISITQSLALELASDNIRVNAIAPGVVDTPMWDIVDAQFAEYENKPIGQKKREVGLAVPLGRMGDPSDIADPCVFLASDAARYITAQTLNVDGGNWMS